MEKSNTSGILELIGKIISKKIKPLNGKIFQNNIAKIKNNKSIDDRDSDSNKENKNKEVITDSENSSDDKKNKSINTKKI